MTTDFPRPPRRDGETYADWLWRWWCLITVPF